MLMNYVLKRVKPPDQDELSIADVPLVSATFISGAAYGVIEGLRQTFASLSEDSEKAAKALSEPPDFEFKGEVPAPKPLTSPEEVTIKTGDVTKVVKAAPLPSQAVGKPALPKTTPPPVVEQARAIAGLSPNFQSLPLQDSVGFRVHARFTRKNPSTGKLEKGEGVRQSANKGEHAGLNELVATREEVASLAYLRENGADFRGGTGISADIRAIVEETADRHGIPRSDLLTMVAYESGGNPNAVSSTGAVGLFQFTGGTAQGYNLVNRFDPVANAEAGALLYKDNAKALQKKLNRPVGLMDVYMAHQLGAHTAANFLKAVAGEEDLGSAAKLGIARQGVAAKYVTDPKAYYEYTEKKFLEKAKNSSKERKASYPVAPAYTIDSEGVTVIKQTAVPQVREAPKDAAKTSTGQLSTQTSATSVTTPETGLVPSMLNGVRVWLKTK